MENGCAPAAAIRVLLADSKPLESELLSDALRRHGFEVLPCQTELNSILSIAENTTTDVVVIGFAGSHSNPTAMSALRALHMTCPRVHKVFLMDDNSSDVAVQAFRLGARGVFCLSNSSFQLFCECIERVCRGEVWATSQQLNSLLDSICQVPSLRVVSANGEKLLTSREEQVVALVADGLSNRHVASELGLSEHTVKKYLFRIFEKLGISNRVELVLYAINHGPPPTSSWIANA